MTQNDTLQPFIFQDKPIRGVLVHLNESYKTVLTRHPYPPDVQRLLGETLAAASLLSATLKFSGWLILQIHGTSAIKLLLAQADNEHRIRGLAHWKEEFENKSFADIMQGGTLAITTSLGQSKERYQGVVSLQGENLAASIETYFEQSEQLPTFIYLAADTEAVVGLLLQVLPGEEAKDPRLLWPQLQNLDQIVATSLMLNLDNEKILKKLFPQEKIQLFDTKGVSFFCNCNRERMEQAIITLGQDDANELLKDKSITVTCEFCNQEHEFDAADVEKIFAAR